MKSKRLRTLAVALIVLSLAVSMLSGLEIEPADPVSDAQSTGEAVMEAAPQTEAPTTAAPLHPSESPAAELEESTRPDGEEASQPEAPVSLPEVPESSPPQTEEPAEERHVCTVEIRCDTVVDTSKLENEAVIPYIPADGTILAETEVEFTPGETAFDVLKRATRQNDIQLEFRSDNVYTGGINIEGIGYLYDFDGGPLSGWMYKVNEQFPNKGTNGFYVSDNDALVWVYTCDLGVDVGDNSVWW